MAEVLLFHHALGLTPGCGSFADELRAAGHVVHTPDFYDGRIFTDVDEGVAHARQIGFETVVERGRRAADELPTDIVYAGFSLGVMPAQALAQTRPGSRGALFFSACLPPSELGDSWPEGVPLQIHVMEGDEWGDVDVAREVGASTESADLFLYPGAAHLFAEPGHRDYDAGAAALLRERVLLFLDRVG